MSTPKKSRSTSSGVSSKLELEAVVSCMLSWTLSGSSTETFGKSRWVSERLNVAPRSSRPSFRSTDQCMLVPSALCGS
eukprot:5968756-Prymnesium_polylepis.3